MSTLTRTMLGVLLASSLHGAAPQIWFAPLDNIARREAVSRGNIPVSDGGPTDFMDLFATGAPWTQAASHVSVFKMYADGILEAPQGQVQQMFSFLKEHNIALAVEFGPLIPSSACGVGVEGFAGAQAQAGGHDPERKIRLRFANPKAIREFRAALLLRVGQMYEIRSVRRQHGRQI